MVKKILLLSSVLFGFVFAQMPRKCFADASAQLEQARLNIFSLIKSRNYAGAQADTQELAVTFSGDANLPAVLYRIAKKYEKKKKYEQAKSIFKKVATDFADTKDASRAQLGTANVDVLSLIASGEDSDAQAKLDILIADFNDNPRLAWTLRRIAGKYKQAKKYEEAKRLYQTVVTDFADTNDASRAQLDAARMDVLSAIESGQDSDAQAKLDGLIVDFKDRPLLAGTLRRIAKKYKQAKKYEEAKRLYQTVAGDFPDTNDALKAKLNVPKINIISLIESGQTEAAQAELDNLIFDFNDHQGFSRAISQIQQGYYRKIIAAQPPAGEDYLNSIKMWERVTAEFPDFFHDDPDLYYFIADCYYSLGRYEGANNLYQQLIQQHPDSLCAGRILLDIPKGEILFFIDDGNDIAAQQALSLLILDFNGHPDLADAIFRIAEQYYNKALSMQSQGLAAEVVDYYHKALSVWERIITDLPSSADYTPRAYYSSAVVNSQELAQYAKGIEYYQIIVDDWPGYQYAWHAQYFVGLYYERLLKSGGIAESEALPKIEQAYKAVVENYPDSSSAKQAALKLGWLNFNKGQWADAAMYFELFLQKSPNNQSLRSVVTPLGQAYEKMGETDSAASVYREFITTANPTDPLVKTITARLEKLEGANK